MGGSSSKPEEKPSALPPPTQPNLPKGFIKCPFVDVVLCNWVGCRDAALSHCQSTHQDKKLQTTDYFQLTTTSPTSRRFMVHKDTLLILSVKCDFAQNIVSYSIHHVKDATTNVTCGYEITLLRNGTLLHLLGKTGVLGSGEKRALLDPLGDDCTLSITARIAFTCGKPLSSLKVPAESEPAKSSLTLEVVAPAIKEQLRNVSVPSSTSPASGVIAERIESEKKATSVRINPTNTTCNSRVFYNSRTERKCVTTTIQLPKVADETDANDNPHVHDELRTTAITTTFNGITFKQPENTVKKETPTHVEFTLPGGAKPKNDDVDLVQVSSLDATGRSIFRDIKEFNRIQSEVFPTAYHTGENMLICAPTGAGKTNIALLAIVHQIKAHMEGKYIRKEDFKIVYVCPMKALATEMVSTFSKKLAPVGIAVRELTGEMQLTKKEIAVTQMLVTTPEKWDVITRKGAVDTGVTRSVKLLILDEVHLLNSDRGPVIEALVARTLRQSVIRIVALSATLPGYLDVATFLRVNPRTGLFFFDNRFRSVPLTMTFIGVKDQRNQELMDRICYEKIVPIVRNGQQVMVFVTSRNLTGMVARNLLTRTLADKDIFKFFQAPEDLVWKEDSFTFKDLVHLVPNGFAVHHAGMCRADKLEVERLFKEGVVKVIVCTTTLAWGVNLPAHAVIIRGTTRYDVQKNALVDMDMLDIMQIFGRAGRPQYDTSGHGMIITSVPYMAQCMTLITSQAPIESQFLKYLPDHLNAEVVLGTVSDLTEAMEWLTSTFVYFRIRKNPIAYQLRLEHVWSEDKMLNYLQNKIREAATTLEEAHMVSFNRTLDQLRPLSYGRIASFFYVSHETMKYFLDHFHVHMSEGDIFHLIAHASEFKQMKVRKEEIIELTRLRDEYAKFSTDLDPKNASIESKVLILIQANISRAKIHSSSLVSDCQFIMQSVHRLARALLEIAVEKKYLLQVHQCLQVAQMVEQQSWFEDQPFLQFKEDRRYKTALQCLEGSTVHEIESMDDKHLQKALGPTGIKNAISKIRYFCKIFPRVEVEVSVKPITEDVVRVHVLVHGNFTWDSVLGEVQHYHVWMEDPKTEKVVHFESFVLSKKMVASGKATELSFTLSSIDPESTERSVVVVNGSYMHTKITHRLDLKKLYLLGDRSVETELLNVSPLPTAALHYEQYQNMYPFTHFNAVQSQLFHRCYTSDTDILLGAPSGCGSTVVAEICMLRLFATYPGRKVVYISPMRALIRKRVQEWSQRFGAISKKVVELTGDATSKSPFVTEADIIVTSPEKWECMCRTWNPKDFAETVGLVVVDGVHLLDEEHGAELEVVVSRLLRVNRTGETKIRVVALSTVMANADGLAEWLGIEERGLYNFGSSIRPIPLDIFVKGFPTKNYPSRMTTMNKPIYQTIWKYSSDGGGTTIVFVSSRKQVLNTSYDLVKFLQAETNPHQWLGCSIQDIETVLDTITDTDLKYSLSYGVGLHHSGLRQRERKVVEDLFGAGKIRVLIATHGLAWSTDLGARLVIVKGTEQYDGVSRRYVDVPVSEVLQMVDRANEGDLGGVAFVLVQADKETFYEKFLMEPFPVESNVVKVLPEYVNAEIANGTVTCKAQLVDLIRSTFFYRRLLVNPTYYRMNSMENVDGYLDDLVVFLVEKLKSTGCIKEVGSFYESTHSGQIAARYYLSCKSVHYLHNNLSESSSCDDLVLHLSEVEEYSAFSVRLGDDKVNKRLLLDLKMKTHHSLESPHLKVLLLLKCYLLNLDPPTEEYSSDLRAVFDPLIRVLQAMINLAAYKNWLGTTRKLIHLCQMLVQGSLVGNGGMMMLPNMTEELSRNLLKRLIANRLVLSNCHFLTIPMLKIVMKHNKKALCDLLENQLSEEVIKVLNRLPFLQVNFSVRDDSTNKVVEYHTDRSEKSVCFEVKSDSCCVFEFNLEREGGSLSAWSRKFTKSKEESWYFLLSVGEELVRMQRFVVKRNKTLQVPVKFPTREGFYQCCSYFICDSYTGLDQKVTFKVKVVDEKAVYVE